MMISIARLRPIRRGMRWVPVPPGRMPSGTSIWLTKVLPFTPKRMSKHMESSLPPPPTRPSICAMVTLFIWAKRSHMAW